MKLIVNARLVLQKAWSIRLALLSAIFSFGEVWLPVLLPFDFMPAGLLASLALLCSVGVVVARVIQQPGSLPKS